MNDIYSYFILFLKRNQIEMETSSTLRRRTNELKKKNGTSRVESESSAEPEFIPRESPLTVLLETSLHIRAIYHIFIAILIILLMDTVTHDLLERGKINVGLWRLMYGFGDVRRAAVLWLYELSLALIFYPGLLVFAYVARSLRKYQAVSRIWSALGVTGVIILQTALLALPVWDLAKDHLALASASIVTLEMIRFSMKIHAVVVASASRCYSNTPLPTFGQYVYFLFAPTLLYRDSYPRTKKIRWGFVAYHLTEVLAIAFYNGFLWERFILPYWSDFGKEPQVEIGKVLRGVFACVLPGIVSFLCGFYCLLHAWFNAAAEVLTFADRLFYEAWWTTSQYSKYYRAWNRVVHAWLRDNIYRPLAPHTGRAFATFTVFFISAAAHELVLALAFGFFYPILMFEFGVFGLLCVPLTATAGKRFPSLINLVMWVNFLLGNGILWSFYPMEHFARRNCPPSESDSYFIPKSWSCPEYILKPNWTFHNPFADDY